MDHILLFFVNVANAGTGGGVSIPLPNPLSAGCPGGTGVDVVCIAGRILNFLRGASVPVVGIFIVWGAIQIIISRGNVERITTGRKTIWYAILGFIAILLASSVVPLIEDILK